MSKIHIANSPFSNTIYAGSLLKDQRTWAKNKTDVTVDALYSVAQHVEKFGKSVELTIASTGEVEYRITVERLNEVK